MNMEKTLLQKVLNAPDLPHIVKVASEVLEKEHQKKEEFYALIHENVKAEFINGEIISHSPVKNKHWRICTKLSGYLMIYVEENGLGGNRSGKSAD
ncbi:MAG: hypothetical protein HC880_18060 [Bacteroidia bacterium]|nr:hypothetical protein [Bacteroidia bacterium]